MNSEFKLIILLMLVLIISFIATSPILKSGLFNIHDDTQVTRVIVMGRALRNGQFPVRWVADLGYGLGYPIFNFYGPLPYYVGGVLYSLGIDAVFATKVMFFLGAVLPGFAMFVAARQCLGNSSALVASGLYLYAPYHAVQIYVRGAVGEYYALIFFPFLLLAFWYVFENKNAKSFLLGSIGLAGIILSHTILGYVTVLFIILAIIFLTLLSILKKIVISILIGSISIVIGGLAISAFYWLPALTEIGYTNVSSQIGPSSNWSDHFVCPDQLWESTWGYGGSAPGCTGDGMSYQLGKLHIIGGVLAIILWKIKASRINSINSTILLSAVISLAAVFFATSYSAGIWKLIPRFEYVQYPWRFLAVANFGLSLIAASGISLVSNKVFRRILALLFVFITITVYGKYFKPQMYLNKTTAEFENWQDIRWRVSRISDEYLAPDIKKPKNLDEVPRTTLPANNHWTAKIEHESEIYSKYAVESGMDLEITIQKAYFPGWLYLVNGKQQLPRLSGGLPVLVVNKGSNVVELIFRNTPVRIISNIISLVSTIGVLYFYYGRKTYS